MLPHLKSPPTYNNTGTLVLPGLTIPDIPAAREVWAESIDSLAKLKGVDQELLKEASNHIRTGVKVKFSSSPPPSRSYDNTRTFTNNGHICTQRLDEYMALGALRVASQPPPPGGYPYIQPLHAILRPGKKPRIAVDLARNFNDFVPDEPFKYSSIHDAVRLSSLSDKPAWYVKVDISSCFLSFPIDPTDVPYFRCRGWDGRVLEFLGMVFGSKTAPRTATMLLDIVSAELMDLGIDHVRYLDDFLFVVSTREAAVECARAAAIIIAKFGLALSAEKTEGPAQSMEFLGIMIDSIRQTLYITKKRKKELKDILSSFSRRSSASVKKVQSLLGKLSFAAAVLPGARPFTRRIIDVIKGKHHRSTIVLDDPFRQDVEYWIGNISSWNGSQHWRSDFSSPCVFGSDASTEGFGYGLEEAPSHVTEKLPDRWKPGHIRAGVWSWSNGDADRQKTHRRIQWGEMFCPVTAALEYKEHLRDQHVVFVIDNESDVNVINRQSTRNPRVCDLLRSLCDVSMRYNFSFSAVHRRGEDNELMDWASRPSIHSFELSTSSAKRHVLQSRSRRPAPARGEHTYHRLLSSPFSSLPTHIPSNHPPLTSPTSVTLINSRCLQIPSPGETGTALWRTGCSGW
jgi:hypothetical protein